MEDSGEDEHQQQHEALEELVAYTALQAMQEDIEQRRGSIPDLSLYDNPAASHSSLKRAGASFYDEIRPFKMSRNDEARGSQPDASAPSAPQLETSSSASVHPDQLHYRKPPTHTHTARPDLAYPTPQTVNNPASDEGRFPSGPTAWQQHPHDAPSGSAAGQGQIGPVKCNLSGKPRSGLPSPEPTPRLSPNPVPSQPENESQQTETTDAGSQITNASCPRSLTPIPLTAPPCAQQPGRSSPLSAIEDVERRLVSPAPNAGLGISGVTNMPGQAGSLDRIATAASISRNASPALSQRLTEGSSGATGTEPQSNPLPDDLRAALQAKIEEIDEFENDEKHNLAQRHMKISHDSNAIVIPEQQALQGMPRLPRSVFVDRPGGLPSALHAAAQGQPYAQTSRRASISPSIPQTGHQNTSLYPPGRNLPVQHLQPQMGHPVPSFQGANAVNEHRRQALSRIGSVNATLAGPLQLAVSFDPREEALFHSLRAHRDHAHRQAGSSHDAQAKQYWTTQFLRYNEAVENFRRAPTAYHPGPYRAAPAQVTANQPLHPLQTQSPYYGAPQVFQSQNIAYRGPSHGHGMSAMARQPGQPTMQQSTAAGGAGPMQRFPFAEGGTVLPGAFSLAVLPQQDLLPVFPQQVMQTHAQRANSSASHSPVLSIQSSREASSGAIDPRLASGNQQVGSGVEMDPNASSRSFDQTTVDDSGYSQQSPALAQADAATQQRKFARASRLRKTTVEAASLPDDVFSDEVKRESPASSKGKQRERESSGPESMSKRVTRSSPVVTKQVAEEAAVAALLASKSEPTGPINKKRVAVSLQRGELVYDSEWDPNPSFFRKISHSLNDPNFGYLHYYWTAEEQLANRRLIQFVGDIDVDTGRIAVTTQVILPTYYARMAPEQRIGVIISLHFKDGVDPRLPMGPGQLPELYWITNYDVLRLAEYLLGLHKRLCHHLGAQNPKARISTRLNAFAKCIAVGKLSKNDREREFAEQLFACADPLPRDSGKKQKLVGWSNFNELLSDVLSRFMVVTQAHATA